MPAAPYGHSAPDRGEVQTRHLQAAGVLALVIMTLFLALHRLPRPGAEKKHDATASAAEEPTEFLPLTVGNKWKYKLTTTNSRTGSKQVQRVEETVIRREGEGFRVLQELDGRQADSRLLTPGPDGIMALEYESSRTPVLFLAAGDLAPGIAWDIVKNRRARIESVAPMSVGTREVDALKIRLERYYGSEETDEPGWLPQGYFWVARGVGIVRRDSSGAKRPRVKTGRVQGSKGPDLEIDTLLELESFELARGDKP